MGRLESSDGPVIAVATHDIRVLEVSRVDVPATFKRLGLVALVMGGTLLLLISLLGITEHT